MAKKQTSQDQSAYVKKSSAAVVAVVCLLAGLFIGFNASLFMDAGTGRAKMTAANLPMPTTEQGSGTPEFDFAELTKAAEANPTQAEGWTRLGHAYFDTNQPAKAIEAYEKSLAIDAANADVWVDLGVMYRRSQKPQKAIECFDRAVTTNPGHETARFNKGIVLLHDLNDAATAIQTWETLLGMRPDYVTPTGKHLHDLVDEVKAAAGK